jgi:hypothetical protein
MTPVIVIHERPGHWFQWLVAGYQLLMGYKNWKTIHTALAARNNDGDWLLVELCWDGLVCSVNDFNQVFDVRDAIYQRVNTENMDKRLQIILSLQRDLKEDFRYCPLTSISQILGKPAWFNCSSLVSYLIGGILVHEPARLHDLMEETIYD